MIILFVSIYILLSIMLSCIFVFVNNTNKTTYDSQQRLYDVLFAFCFPLTTICVLMEVVLWFISVLRIPLPTYVFLIPTYCFNFFNTRIYLLSEKIFPKDNK